MAGILVIHGIGQQTEGPSTLRARLFPALQDGLSRAGTGIQPADVSFASYGELFRPPGEFLAATPYYDASDVGPGYEEELLMTLWQRAASCDPAVLPPDEEVLARTPSAVRRALAALSRSRFLAGIAERAFIGDLKQVRMYFSEPALRTAILAKVAAAITDETRVVVAHSLGSVVAYEALFAYSNPSIRALVTLGSPLGLPNLVFDRLSPQPATNVAGGPARGAWPPVRMWGNIADAGDIVAVVEDLRPLFGAELRQARVHNGSRAHDMSSYLTDPLTGGLIAAGLDA